MCAGKVGAYPKVEQGVGQEPTQEFVICLGWHLSQLQILDFAEKGYQEQVFVPSRLLKPSLMFEDKAKSLPWIGAAERVSSCLTYEIGQVYKDLPEGQTHKLIMNIGKL